MAMTSRSTAPSPKQGRSRTGTATRTMLALALAAIAVTTGAHDRPHPHWCSASGSSVVVVGKFDFSGNQMRVNAQQSAHLPGSCGQVDRQPEHWFCASEIAERYCKTLSESLSLNQVAVPVFAGPSPMVSDSHHEDYRLEAGLYGACVVCMSDFEEPPSPIE